MHNISVRLGFDSNRVSTWKEEYVKLSRHSEVPQAELCLKAWDKMFEFVGGEQLVYPVEERYHF